MAPSSLKQPMEHPLCESRMTEQIPRRLKQDATVIAVIEMSQSSWLVGQSSPGRVATNDAAKRGGGRPSAIWRTTSASAGQFTPTSAHHEKDLRLTPSKVLPLPTVSFYRRGSHARCQEVRMEHLENSLLDLCKPNC